MRYMKQFVGGENFKRAFWSLLIMAFAYLMFSGDHHFATYY
jgi:hypothetical protein